MSGRKSEPSLAAAAGLPEPSVASFGELGLDRRLVAALAARDITTPFAIQARALHDALAGRDVLGRAETGSGKTLAFGLPMLSRVAVIAGRPRATAPRGLVLVPTRELEAGRGRPQADRAQPGAADRHRLRRGFHRAPD